MNFDISTRRRQLNVWIMQTFQKTTFTFFGYLNLLLANTGEPVIDVSHVSLHNSQSCRKHTLSQQPPTRHSRSSRALLEDFRVQSPLAHHLHLATLGDHDIRSRLLTSCSGVFNFAYDIHTIDYLSEYNVLVV